MNLDQATKAMLLRVMVLCLVAAAGWHFGISKLSTKLGTTKTEFASYQAEIDQSQATHDMATETPAKAIAGLRDQADLLNDFWAVSGDTSLLYDTIMQLSHESGVTIRRIEPRRMPPARVPNGLAGTEEWSISVIGYSIDLAGEFAAVGHFVQAIQNETGMSRVDSIRVMLDDNRDAAKNQIRASISTMHYGLNGALDSFGQQAKAGDE